MYRPTLLNAAHVAALDADAELGRALSRLSIAALDARDAVPGGQAALQRALRLLERAHVARRRAATAVHALNASARSAA